MTMTETYRHAYFSDGGGLAGPVKVMHLADWKMRSFTYCELPTSELTDQNFASDSGVSSTCRRCRWVAGMSYPFSFAELFRETTTPRVTADRFAAALESHGLTAIGLTITGDETYGDLHLFYVRLSRTGWRSDLFRFYCHPVRPIEIYDSGKRSSSRLSIAKAIQRCENKGKGW